MDPQGAFASSSESAVSDLGGQGWYRIIRWKSFIEPRTCRLAVCKQEGQASFHDEHQHRNILRRFRAKDSERGAGAEFSEFLAAGCNKHFDALFPDGEPVQDAQRIDQMMERFKTDTKPTERDRNDARAHRFRPLRAVTYPRSRPPPPVSG